MKIWPSVYRTWSSTWKISAYGQAWNFVPGFILLIMKTLEAVLEEADFRLGSLTIRVDGTACFEITGADKEFVPRPPEDGYRLRTEKTQAGYRLLLLPEGGADPS